MRRTHRLRPLLILFTVLGLGLGCAACASDDGTAGGLTPGTTDAGDPFATSDGGATTPDGAVSADAGVGEDGGPTGCVASCENKMCGDDGCGGSCGECVPGMICTDTGVCDTDPGCIPSCANKTCGDDGCGGSCGECGPDMVCTDNGVCDTDTTCVPNCIDLECGDDGCGGTCGVCEPGTVCNAGGLCEEEACIGSCVNKECGDDGCGESCGQCDQNESCEEGICTQEVCTPDCDGKGCGDDGCGGSCGECKDGEFCNAIGMCECMPDCDGKMCGDNGCGGLCGSCGDGEICSAGGTCTLPYTDGALGAYCGPSSTCAPEVMDPLTGLMTANDAWPDCLNLACDSGFCTGAGLPGVFVLAAQTCSKSCIITEDNINNATGLPGADGVEDPGAPSDCMGFVDGPSGADWRCVNFGVAGSPANSFCMPGTTFQSCDAGTQCPEGEGCDITTLGGLGQRCFAKAQSGSWGEAAMMTTQCNDNPYDGDVSICEQGICYTMLGCSNFCQNSADCDTTQLFEDTGCDPATNTCIGWESKNCLSDADCSAWYCNEPSQLFSNVPEYTPQLCFPNVCDTVADCPSDFYCRWFYNGEAGELADWEHRCLARDPEGAALGEPCDSDPTDNIPGDTCQAQDLCVGGYCSAICDDDSLCGPEQVCRTEEANLDTDGDGLADTMLPLEYCITLPGKEGPCLSEATCTDEQRCGIYETHVPGDEGTLTVAGYCHDTDAALGTLGQSCGATAAEVDQCENFCLGANAAADIAGLCTQTCETHTDCPAAEVDGVTSSFRCQTYVYSYGIDEVATEDNIYIGLCVPNPAGSSGEDCSADFTCASETEACSSISVNFGPDYPAGTDYICLDTTANGASIPTKELGETCNPTAAFDECKTMYCLADDTGMSGICTAPCDPNNDQCGPGLFCEVDIAFPRSGVYEANAGTIWRCNTDTSCTPNCDGLACGDDGCGGSCGTCPDGGMCEAGACVCMPMCDGLECGDDGCGGICGECADGATCESGLCVP